METRVERGQAQEDRVTGAIESVTSQAPSSTLLGLAIGSMAISLILPQCIARSAPLQYVQPTGIFASSANHSSAPPVCVWVSIPIRR